MATHPARMISEKRSVFSDSFQTFSTTIQSGDKQIVARVRPRSNGPVVGGTTVIRA